MPRLEPRSLGILVAAVAVSLAVATLVAWFLESSLGVPNASAVYLVAVVVSAYLAGAAGAIASAVGSFLLYNYFFTEPRGTFAIHDPGVWLNVVLLLFVGVVVGQLAALQRARAADARAREREAVALFHLSRVLAERASTLAVLGDVASVLLAETRAERVWIRLGTDDASERLAADTGTGRPPSPTGFGSLRRQMSGDVPERWIRVHQPGPRPRPPGNQEAFRVRMEAGDQTLGSIWSLRERRLGEPDRTETRLYAAAADQVGQSLAHDRLAAESQAAEIARQSDALKSALLQSVSHDLRTPLATIRAAAGSLDPDSGLSPDEQRESVAAIDREVEYLNRIVTNLLDLSRIEAGALRAERDAYELDDLVGRSLERLRARIGDRPLDVELAAPPVEVDPTFLDEAVANLLDNAAKYTPPGTAMRVLATERDAVTVRLTVEVSGPCVPYAAHGRLFDKFYRVPG
ncbi:MAG: DUF4118 domain-containing protein, partial [Candidatus Limnocylindrales bacterium]